MIKGLREGPVGLHSRVGIQENKIENVNTGLVFLLDAVNKPQPPPS